MAGGTSYYRGRVFSFGAWVRAPVANSARIAIGDNTGDSYSAYHSGSSNWEFLTVIREFGGGASNFNVSLVIESGSTTAQINGAILVEGSFVPAFERGSGDIVLPIVLQNLGSAPNDLVWLMKYLNNTYTQGEPCMVLRSNKNVLGNDLRVVITRYGHVALWPVEGPEARPIPKSPYDPSKLNALTIDGDIVFGDHLVRATTQVINLKRLPLALPYCTLNAGINDTDTVTTVAVTQWKPELPTTGFPYRAVIWNGSEDPDYLWSDAEIINVTAYNTVTIEFTFARGQDGTTKKVHSLGDRITKALNIQQDTAITNLLSGAYRGSNEFFGGAGIGMQPIGRTDEVNGSVFLDAFGRGTDKDSNCIFFRTRDGNTKKSTEHVRITSDGCVEQSVDDIKDSLYHKRVVRLNGISTWTTIATITPSPIANHYTRGHVEARIGGHNNGANTGLLISKWYININAGTITVGFIGTDTTDGAAPPQFRLNVSGGDIQVQVNKDAGSGTGFYGTAFVEAFLPRAYKTAGADLEWSVK